MLNDKPKAGAEVVHKSGEHFDDKMRRSNKASSGTQVKKRTSHLDLPSNDDDGGSISKIHPKRKSASKPVIAVAILCGLAAVGTLFYVSNKVFQAPKTMTGTGKEAVPGSNSLPERFMAQQNRLLPPDSIYRTKVQDIHGDWQQLMQYSGSVSLVVNVACE